MEWMALFTSAFVSATLAPGGSEALFLWLAWQGKPALGLVGVASLGNTLGAWTTYQLARWGLRRWKPGQTKRAQKARFWMRRYGGPALLLSWMPVIGDALCAAAGALGYPVASFLLWTALGKTTRYAFLLWLGS